MNMQNYQFLSETLEGLGFSNVFHQPLKTMLTLGNKDEFTLKASAIQGKDKITIEPLFRRSQDEEYADRYFLNRIRGTLEKENGEKIIADFPINKKNGYRQDEMIRMLKDNKPVYKKFRGENIGSWGKVGHPDEDGISRVRRYPDDATNFRIERHVDKLPIKFASQAEREDFIIDLQSGKTPSQMIKKEGKFIQATIAVGEQIGGLDVYDTEGKLIMSTNPNHKVQLVAHDNLTLTNTTDQNEDLSKGAKNTQNAGQEQQQQLPDTTKQLMNTINNAKANQGQQQGQGQGGQRRRAS